MSASRNDQLGEIASDAGLERNDFLASATAQLRGFLEANESRLRQLGGLVLIDEEPDYLSVAPDGTFRSRTRYQDADGQWHSETEVVESAAELIELYNPADIYAAFVEAAKEAAGMEAEPTGAEDLPHAAGVSATDTVVLDEGRAYAEAADRWAEGRDEEPRDAEDAAHRLYDLALEFQEESQESEADLLSRFEAAAAKLTAALGDLTIIDDEDERLTLLATGELLAEVLPEGSEGIWRKLTEPDQLVEYYDPTDVFGDLADALAEAFPSVAPPEAAEQAEADESAAGEPDAGTNDVVNAGAPKSEVTRSGTPKGAPTKDRASKGAPTTGGARATKPEDAAGDGGET